jgi:hypothetical protein
MAPNRYVDCVRCQDGRELFKVLDGSCGLGVMPRTGAELAIAQRVQLAAQRLPRDSDPELLPVPVAQPGCLARRLTTRRGSLWGTST